MPFLQSYLEQDAASHGSLVSLGGIIVTASVSVILYFASLVVYRLWLHPLAKFPGPKLWALTDIPFTYETNISAKHVFTITKFHLKYGPIVRVGPNRLSLEGSVGWPQVYGHRIGGAPEFTKASEFFHEGDNSILATYQQDDHRKQRRQLSHAFSEAALLEQSSIITKYVDLLIMRAQEHADAGKAMDVVKWLNFTTFDVIGDLMFGEPFGSLENSAYHPWVLGLFEGVKGDSLERACRRYPAFGPLLKWVLGSTTIEAIEEHRSLASRKAKGRMARGLEPRGRRDFMTYMMQKSRDGHQGLSEAQIISNSTTLIIAGSETTATALSGFFFYVGQTPRVKSRLIDEIRQAFKDDSDIGIKSTARLEYLHATLEETLRVYPPAATASPRLSPGADIDGKLVPQGAVVHVNQWSTFRNPEHFFEPDAFFPERWLKKSHPLYDEKFSNDNHAVFKPFSFGPRDCIGKNLAYSEMRLIAAKLLYRLDFELMLGQQEWHSKQVTYVFWDKGPLNMFFTDRKLDSR